jgi:flagellin
VPGIGGLSIANNVLANAIALQLNGNQSRLQGSVTRLSSGLRINTAADDPSGLAIAEKLQAQVNGFDQAVRNVQDANNAVTVAEGALQTTTDILQRIRTLSVEAASDIASSSDRANLQTEVKQLLLEVNRISQNTSFNGIALLDGSHAGFVPAQAATAEVTTNSVLASAGSSTAGATLVSGAKIAGGPFSQFAPLDTILQQNVSASSQPQTVKVSPASFIQAGQVFASGTVLVNVQSVDAAASTITATFSGALASGAALHAGLSGSSTNAVTSGQAVMNLGGGPDAVFSLYAGEALQIFDGSPEEVTVQKVLSPTSFVADFGFAHAAGAAVFNFNQDFSGSAGPQTIVMPAGVVSNTPPPVGTPAYVEETSTGFPATNGSTISIAGVGSVVAITANTETVFIPSVTNSFGGSFDVVTAVGNGNNPLVPTTDGTIALQVINTGASIAVQATFYDTAAQTSAVSPFLLAPGERAMPFDGVVLNLGNFATADVGLSSYIKVLQATSATTNPDNSALTVHSGATEGTALQIGIEATSTAVLRISNTDLLASAASNPSLGAEDAIGQLDFALQKLVNQRAQLGAVAVRLSEDGNNDDIASVNLQASESSIRDLNVGQETTTFNRLQILTQVGTAVLSQANSNAQSVLRLFP